MRKIPALIAAALVCAAAYVPAASPAASAASLAAVTPPAPTSAAEMNARMSAVDGIGTLFDVARTEALPDGRWLMLTGDASLAPGHTLPYYDNVAVIIDGAGQRRVDTPWPGGHFFPRWEDGSEFWPNEFFVVGDRGYAIGGRVKPYEGMFNWTDMGAYGAVFEIPAGGDPRFLRYFPTPSSLQGVDKVQWNGAIEYDAAAGWVYIHGVRDLGDSRYHARDAGYVARVSLPELEVPHRWKFWTGSSWVARHDRAVATIPLDQAGPNCGADPDVWGSADCWGSSSGYTLHRRPDGTWQATTKEGGDLSEGMTAYRSASPRGPWTKHDLLPPADVCSHECYLTGAAATIPTVSGNLLVMYSRINLSPVWLEVPQ